MALADSLASMMGMSKVGVIFSQSTAEREHELSAEEVVLMAQWQGLCEGGGACGVVSLWEEDDGSTQVGAQIHARDKTDEGSLTREGQDKGLSHSLCWMLWSEGRGRKRKVGKSRCTPMCFRCPQVHFEAFSVSKQLQRLVADGWVVDAPADGNKIRMRNPKVRRRATSLHSRSPPPLDADKQRGDGPLKHRRQLTTRRQLSCTAGTRRRDPPHRGRQGRRRGGR